MKRLGVMALGLLCVAGFGCANARYVNRTQTGGTLALTGPRDEAYAKARSQMEGHCQGPYTITQEGEVVVGQDQSTYNQQDTNVSRNGRNASSAGTQSTSTRDAVEWRVTYVCGVAAPQAPPTLGQPGAAPAPVGYPAQPYPPQAQPGYPPPPSSARSWSPRASR